MLQSMTGFGRGEASAPTCSITVELRTVNSKGLDLVGLRIPTHFKACEVEVRNLLAMRLERGKVECNVQVQWKGASPESLGVNDALFAASLLQLQTTVNEVQLNCSDDTLVAALLRQPEVWRSEEKPLQDEEKRTFMLAFERAVDALVACITQEGQATERDLRLQVDTILALRNDVDGLKDERITLMREGIVRAIAQLTGPNLPPVDDARLAQEFAFHIERLDVNEELQRLEQHCRYFIETLESHESQGRKLGFIAQEMGREINTLGSKANHVGMQRLVVQMKDHLEKIKEQVLNAL